MGYYEIDPDVVYSGATSLQQYAPEASRVALHALAAYSTAGGAVGHPVLSAAYFDFADEHSTLHHSIGPAIETLASSLANGTNTMVNAQDESLAVHTGSARVAERATATNSAQVQAG